MIRFLPVLLVFISLNAFAQSYTEKIAKHREAYKQDFITDSRSPLKKKDLENLHFYDADSTYKVLADVTLLQNEKVFKMPTYDGTSSDYFRYAHVTFSLNGKKTADDFI